MNTFEWETLEYQSKERPQDWYWAVAVIVVALAIASFIFVNFILSIFVVLSGATLILIALRDPDVITVAINDRGVQVNQKLYPFPVFDSFWVEENEEVPLIILKSEQVYTPLILVPIAEGIDLEELRDFLVEYLDEEELEVPLSRKVLEYLGF